MSFFMHRSLLSAVIPKTLDQGAIKCIKATYTRLVFGKLPPRLHANPDCDLTGLWNRFSIADAIALIAVRDKVFGKLRDTLHANPDCDLTGLWNRFSIADAIALIAVAVHEIKSRTVSGCWKRLCRDAVSECEDLGAIDEEVMDIVNVAKELGGEGFSDMIEDDIREHIQRIEFKVAFRSGVLASLACGKSPSQY
ncbi:hypothetical protein M513_12581 [Trichuris suis]|uniref:Uncharacterized protein n=1 Tax=Trichuris suis TaxID=68888 RepID=A0A085LNI4_9BILA|nr:hypothetical protein M513_12581 [Trichuris suis]